LVAARGIRRCPPSTVGRESSYQEGGGPKQADAEHPLSREPGGGERANACMSLGLFKGEAVSQTGLPGCDCEVDHRPYCGAMGP